MTPSNYHPLKLYLYFLSLKEVGGAVEDVGSVRGVVVGVARLVVGLDGLQPVGQARLRDAEETAHVEPRHRPQC